MIRRHIQLLLFSIAISTINYAQNLVNNGGFEVHDSCPSGQSSIEFAKALGWRIPAGNITGTPDYFHTCATNLSNTVPSNLWTFQYPYEGDAYAGVITYHPDYDDVREYICTRLDCHLTAGKQYRLGFYINTANNSRYASNSIGMLLSETLPVSNTNTILIQPQLEFISPTAYHDTANWVLVTDTMVAIGTERYVTIGNFLTDAETIVQQNGPFYINPQAHFLIDNVFIYEINPPPASEASDTLLGPDKWLCPFEGSAFDLSAPDASYLWHNNATSSTFNTNLPGTYFVTVTTPTCIYSDTIHIDYYAEDDPHCTTTLEMGNVFTPNADGINDLFAPVEIQNVAEFHMTIFNRWGEVIFSTDDKLNFWDGNTKNLPCPEGVYFWQVNATNGYGIAIDLNGFVQLAR